MSIKRASLKILGYICGIAVTILIIYIISHLLVLAQIEGVADAREYIRETSFRTDTTSDHNTALFYLFSAIFAALAGFFALLSILSAR